MLRNYDRSLGNSQRAAGFWLDHSPGSLYKRHSAQLYWIPSQGNEDISFVLERL